MYREFVIDDVGELVGYAMFEIEDCDYPIVFIAKYFDAIEILKELISDEDVNIYSLDIHSEEWDGYDKEYLIELGNDYSLCCTPFWSNDRPLRYDASRAYIMGDCNHKCVGGIDAAKVYLTMYSKDFDDCVDNFCCKQCSDFECDNYQAPGEYVLKIKSDLKPEDIENVMDIFQEILDFKALLNI